MKKLVFVLLMVVSTSVLAETWSALGLLTTKVQGQPAKVELVEIDGFDSKQTCQFVVTSEAFSKEHIGVGGTNGKLPRVDWNFDGDCWLKRSD